MRSLPWLMVAVLFLSSLGCYGPRGGGSLPLAAIPPTEQHLHQTSSTPPVVRVPATIAVIRLEGSAYGGRILTVDTRSDVERAALSSLHGLSQIADVITLSSSIVGHEPKSIEDICRAADSLRADLVLIYTVGATSTFDELSLGPIDILTMGVLPTRAHTVRVAAIASLIDVPSATLIGTAHVHEEVSQHGNFWTEEQACRSALRRAEADALRRLFESFEREAWPDVLATYARR